MRKPIQTVPGQHTSIVVAHVETVHGVEGSGVSTLDMISGRQWNVSGEPAAVEAYLFEGGPAPWAPKPKKKRTRKKAKAD